MRCLRRLGKEGTGGKRSELALVPLLSIREVQGTRQHHDCPHFVGMPVRLDLEPWCKFHSLHVDSRFRGIAIDGRQFGIPGDRWRAEFDVLRQPYSRILGHCERRQRYDARREKNVSYIPRFEHGLLPFEVFCEPWSRLIAATIRTAP